MNYDLIVIGGGNTGLGAAHRVAKAGRKVALVDRGQVGGLCSRAGCNPKKVLVRASEVLAEVQRASLHGIDTGPVRLDWSKVIARRHAFTDPVTAQTEEGLRKAGIDLITGTARFLGPDRIDVEGRTLTASSFVIATGSTPRRLDVPGIDLTHISDDVFSLEQVPRRLVILGSGAIAFELGFLFARLGSEVTMVARGRKTVPGFDADFMAPVLEFADRLGLHLLRETRVEAVKKAADGSLSVEVQKPDGPATIPADFVLRAVGRVPALEALDLTRAGVESSAKGVVVNEFLRCPGNRRVYAGGDAHGEYQLSPVATYEGEAIARNILEGDVQRMDYRSVPRAVFTTPPLAQVGLTEQEARLQYAQIEVVSSDMGAWKVFAIDGDEAARARVIIDKRSDRLLGAQLWAPAAPDMIGFLGLALRQGVSRSELESLVYPYPCASSSLRYALRA